MNGSTEYTAIGTNRLDAFCVAPRCGRQGAAAPEHAGSAEHE
jgi:hypothetical protein